MSTDNAVPGPPVVVAASTTTTHWMRDLVSAIAGIVLIASLVAIGIQDHDARLKAEAQISAANKSETQLNAQIADLKSRMDVRDKADQAQQEQTSKLITATQTASQALAAMPKVIELPAVAQQITAKQADAVNAAALPNAPKVSAGDAIVPQGDLKPVFDQLAQCGADEKSLATCKQDDAALQAANALEKQQTADEHTKFEADEARLKGGTWRQRALQALKCTAQAGVTAGAGALANSKHPAEGAAIGGAIGAGVCEVFRW